MNKKENLKKNLKKNLNKMGIPVVGNYIRKRDIKVLLARMPDSSDLESFNKLTLDQIKEEVKKEAIKYQQKRSKDQKDQKDQKDKDKIKVLKIEPLGFESSSSRNAATAIQSFKVYVTESSFFEYEVKAILDNTGFRLEIKMVDLASRHS